MNNVVQYRNKKNGFNEKQVIAGESNGNGNPRNNNSVIGRSNIINK